MNAMHHANIAIATATAMTDDGYYTSLDAAMEAAEQMRLFVARLLAAMSSAG